MRTLILGLGNPGVVNERVGLEVARGVHALLGDPDVDIIEASAESVDLVGIVVGYDKVVVVDCIGTGEGDVGELRRLGLSELELVTDRGSGLATEYRVTVGDGDGRVAAMPRDISVYAIEVGGGGAGTGLSELAEDAVPRLVEQIAKEEFGELIPINDWL